MPTRSPRRLRRALLAPTLVVPALALLPLAPAADAATTGTVEAGTATWGLSTYLNSANFGRPNPLAAQYVAPAAFDATTRLSSWGEATGTVAPDGSADLVFDGTSVNFAGTGGGWLRLSDLAADLDADGNGTVSAVVEYGTSVTGNPPAMQYDPTQAPTRGPERVDLVDLAGNTAADLVRADGVATWTGLDGAWAPEFSTFLGGDASGTPAAWTYASTVSSADGRTPLPFTFVVDEVVPSLTAAVTGASYGQGLTVDVDGTGFRGDSLPGDQGVYVGIAEAGGLPDVSTPGAIGLFAGASFVRTAQIVDGVLDATVIGETAKLDPTKSYSVYTWQAHAHSNTSQDTETPLEIDWAALEPDASSVVAGGDTATVYGTAATITATVPADGEVTLTGLAEPVSVDAVDGVATFETPTDLAAGTYPLTLDFAGFEDFGPASATAELVVAKADSTVRSTWTRKPSTAKPGRATVRVLGPVAAPEGTVTFVLGRHGNVKKVTGTLVDGVASINAPKVGRGTWNLRVAYPGTANLRKDKLVGTVTVK